MPQDPNKQPPTPPNFEKSLAELERIVQRMEQGDQTLEQTLIDFERGMVLSAQCRHCLEAAQQHVDKIVRKHSGEHTLEPMPNRNPNTTPR